MKTKADYLGELIALVEILADELGKPTPKAEVRKLRTIARDLVAAVRNAPRVLP